MWNLYDKNYLKNKRVSRLKVPGCYQSRQGKPGIRVWRAGHIAPRARTQRVIESGIQEVSSPFFPSFCLFVCIVLFYFFVWFLWGRTLLIPLGWPEILYVHQFGLELTMSCITKPLEFWNYHWTHHRISGQGMVLFRFRIVQPNWINLIKKLFPRHVKRLIFL